MSDVSKTCPRKVALAREPMLWIALPRPGFAFWSSPGVEPGVAEGTSALASLPIDVGSPCLPVVGVVLAILDVTLTNDGEKQSVLLCCCSGKTLWGTGTVTFSKRVVPHSDKLHNLLTTPLASLGGIAYRIIDYPALRRRG